MRVIAAALVLAGVSVGCTKSKPEASPADLAAAAPAPRFPPLRQFVTATGLADAYAKNPVAGARDYEGKVMELVGVVDSIDREGDGLIVVRLRAGRAPAPQNASRLFKKLSADDRRWIPCRFRGRAIPSVADVEPGQLVGIAGVVIGPKGDVEVPIVEAAVGVNWIGDRPGAPPTIDEAERAALHAAYSAAVCLEELAAATGKPLDAAAAPLVRRAHEELPRLGAPLDCPNPLIAAMLACDRAHWADERDECTAQVRRVNSKMLRSMKGERP